MGAAARIVRHKPGVQFAEILLVHALRLRRTLQGLRDRRGEVREAGQTLATGPGLGGSATDRAVNDADRHPQVGLQIAGEEIADGGEILDGGGRADGPRASGGRLRQLGVVLVDIELADERMGGGSDFMFPTDDGFLPRAEAELAFHVGLAAAKPDFTDQDVVKYHRSRCS